MQKQLDFGKSKLLKPRSSQNRRPPGGACSANAAGLAGHIRGAVREDPRRTYRNRSFAGQAEQENAAKEFYDEKAAALRLQEARERIKREILDVKERYPCANDCELLERLIEVQASTQAINVQRQRIERIQKGLQSPTTLTDQEPKPRGPCYQPPPEQSAQGPSRPTGVCPRPRVARPQAAPSRSVCAMKRPASKAACPKKPQAVCKKPVAPGHFEQSTAQQRLKVLRERVKSEIDEVKKKMPSATECEILNKLMEMNAHPQTISYQQSKIKAQAQCNPNSMEPQTCKRIPKKKCEKVTAPSAPAISPRTIPRTTAGYVEEMAADPRFQQTTESPRNSRSGPAEPCPRQEPVCPRQEPVCPRQEPVCPRQEPVCPRQEPVCPRQEPVCPRQESVCPRKIAETPCRRMSPKRKQESTEPMGESVRPRLAPRRLFESTQSRLRRSKDRSQAVCKAPCFPKSPGSRSQETGGGGWSKPSSAVYYPSTAMGGGACKMPTLPEEPDWLEDHRNRLERIRNKYLQNDDQMDLDVVRSSGMTDISAITRMGVECGAEVDHEVGVPIAESTQRIDAQPSTSILPADRTVTDVKYMIDEEKLEIRTMHSIIAQHMEPASQVQFKDMSSLVPHVFSDDTETSPEVAAAILQSDEKGLSLRSTPAKVYSSLFQGPENDKTVMKVNAPSSNTKAGYIVPLSTEGAESAFITYETRGLYEPVQDEEGEMPSPKKDTGDETNTGTIKDNLGYSVTSMKPDSQASMSSDDGRFKITLQPELPQQPDFYQVRGSQPPQWFPGYYVTMGDSPRINVLDRPWSVLEKAWREFIPSKTKPEFGKVIVGT